MTRRQWFESGSPLWVKGINAYGIKHILQFIERTKQHGACQLPLTEVSGLQTLI